MKNLDKPNLAKDLLLSRHLDSARKLMKIVVDMELQRE